MLHAYHSLFSSFKAPELVLVLMDGNVSDTIHILWLMTQHQKNHNKPPIFDIIIFVWVSVWNCQALELNSNERNDDTDMEPFNIVSSLLL